MWYLLEVCVVPAVNPRSSVAEKSRPPTPPLRIALTLPGGVTPGAFEAGAICALVTWIQEVGKRQPDAVIVDTIAGASAGALTSLLAARVLLAGEDPLPVFQRAWVAEPTLRALTGVGSWAPLSLRRARVVAHSLLLAPGPLDAGPTRRQSCPVRISIALANLRGLVRMVPQEGLTGFSEDLSVTDYLEWATHDLEEIAPGARPPSDVWTRAVDSAIASASHPMAFPPVLLEPPGIDASRLGVRNLPTAQSGAKLWYSDGGLVNNEPLARCLGNISELDTDSESPRLVILVRNLRRPVSADDPAWSGARRPRWSETLIRAFDLLATHAAAQDLARVEKINQRIRWTQSAATTLVAFLQDDPDLRDRLRELLATIRKESMAGPDDLEEGTGGVSAAADLDMQGLLETVLRAAAGIRNKRTINLAVIEADPDMNSQARIGPLDFLQRAGRHNRFAVGYWTTLKWIESTAALSPPVADDVSSAALLSAQRRVRIPKAYRSRGRLSPSARLELSRVAARVAGILAADIRAARRRRGDDD